MNIIPLVTQSAELAQLCSRWAEAPFIAVDTEFMRENTFWPELCVIQIASETDAACIDPKAAGLDMSPLLALLVDGEPLKIFHAGGQDLEIFYNLTGRTPQPLFDTQIAAMALGMGEQVGYTGLVEAMLGIQIDKGARFTDWARRPLDKRQLDYALGDVTHLVALFPKMLERLRRTGRGAWLDAEMERLGDPATYASDPDDAWQRIKAPSRNPAVMGRLRAVARWREMEARDKNVPRGRIAKDETLSDLAAHPPRGQVELAKVRGLGPAWGANEIGRRLIAALADAKPLTEDELPPRDRPRAGLSTDAGLVADLLKLMLKVRAKEAGVAPKLLARGDELEALAAGRRDGLAVLEGWRREAFGLDALALVDGRIGFAVREGRMTMRTIAESD